MKMQGKFVLITGSSSGLGKCFAIVFAKNGYNVLLVGKEESGLINIANNIKKEYGVDAKYLALDLTLKGAGKQVFDWVAKQNIRVYCLINNAGMGNYGKFIKIPLEKEINLIDVSVKMLTELCHRFLPEMVKAKDGKILNIASMAAFQPGPYYATYYASKAYVLSLTEALALEYKKDNITISALCPGPMPTNFFKEAGMTPSKFMRLQMTDPQKIAEIGFRELMKNKTIIIPGIKNRLIPFGSRVLPRSVIAKISKKLVEWAAENKEPFTN